MNTSTPQSSDVSSELDTNHVPRTTSHEPRITVRHLGLVPYEQAWEAMKAFTIARTPETVDEIWLLEHPPVYTYGVAGRSEHFPPANCGISVIKVDRGGQVTFHGPGQLIAYALIDLRRRNIGVRDLVKLLEQAVLDLMEESGIHAKRRDGAPGVYVDGAKIAALGLRLRGGCSYHGLSLNVDVDLTPFNAIDPCGYPGLVVTRTRDLGLADSMDELGERLIGKITHLLDATEKRK